MRNTALVIEELRRLNKMAGFWIFADNVPMLENYFPYAVQLFFYFLIFMAVKEVLTIYRWHLDRELMLMLNNVTIEKVVKINGSTPKRPLASEPTQKRKAGRPPKTKPPEVASNPLHTQKEKAENENEQLPG